MNKKLILLCVLTVLVTPLFADYFDLGLTLGTNAHLFERDLDASRLKMASGVTVGLTDVWEFDVQVDSQLVPEFFGDSSVSLLAQRAMKGQRSTGSIVAGVALNMLVGGGVVFSPYREDGTFGLSHLVVSLTPFTIGSPGTGKRERMFSFSVAYNLTNHQVGLFMDLLKFDYYIVGKSTDYR